MLCAFQCVFVCVVIIEALLLLWEFADVNFWLQCGLRMKGVYCFITHKCCSGKTLLLKPEPSLDLPVDPLRKTHESRQFSPPYTSPKPMKEFADQVEL